MRVREADPGEREAVRGVLNGAALAVDPTLVDRAVETGDALVAVSDAGTVVGALVLDGERIAAVAVRRRRRGQGIGTALVEAAAARRERLVARFDGDVRAFYRSLGFTVEPADEAGRFRGCFPERKR